MVWKAALFLGLIIIAGKAEGRSRNPKIIIYSPEEVTWGDPQHREFYNEWQDLCANNAEGYYQNFRNCSQFIACGESCGGDGKKVSLWECPNSFIFNPICECCEPPHLSLSNSKSNYQVCTWPSIWTEDEQDCRTFGERDYGSPLTLPLNSKEMCGQEIRYCEDYQETFTGICPEGTGYSKTYLGCLNYSKCMELDAKMFGIVNNDDDDDDI